MNLEKQSLHSTTKKVLTKNNQLKMKNIFLLILFFVGSFTTCTAQSEKIDKFFNDLQKQGVTSIEIKKPMFNLLNSIDINDSYLNTLKPIMQDVDGMKLLVFSKITFPDHLKSENVWQIKKNEEKSQRVDNLLDSLKMKELMLIKNDDASINFLAEKEKEGVLENLIFKVDSKEEIAVFMLQGKMKMDDVNRMIQSSENKLRSFSNKHDTKTDIKKTTSITNENRNVGQFSGVNVATGVVLNFKQETPISVNVVADADKLQYIVTRVENGILNVYIDDKVQKNLKFKNISVNVSAPNLEQIKTTSGAVFNSINAINETKMNVEVSSGAVVNADLNIKEQGSITVTSGAVINSRLKANELIMKLTSGSTANLNGNVGFGKLEVSSGATGNTGNLSFKKVEIHATSGASVSCDVEEELVAKASSGGSIKYKGNPKINSDISKISGGSLKSIN